LAVAAGAPDGFLARLAGQLADLPWQAREVPALRGADLGVAVEPRRAGLRLTMQTPDGRRFRRDVEGLGQGEAALEAVAVAVRSALLALDRGEALAWRELRPVPPAWGFAVLAGGEPTGLGVGAAALDASLWRDFGVGRGALGVVLRSPLVDADGLTRLTAYRGSVYLAGVAELGIGDDWALFAGARASLDLWWRQTEALAARAAPRGDRVRAAAAAGPQVGVARRLGGGVSLRVAAGGDVLLGRPRFTYGGAGAEARSTWPVLPWLRAGVAWGAR
jgi:hypothetical protein